MFRTHVCVREQRWLLHHSDDIEMTRALWSGQMGKSRRRVGHALIAVGSHRSILQLLSLSLSSLMIHRTVSLRRRMALPSGRTIDRWKSLPHNSRRASLKKSKSTPFFSLPRTRFVNDVQGSKVTKGSLLGPRNYWSGKRGQIKWCPLWAKEIRPPRSSSRAGRFTRLFNGLNADFEWNFSASIRHNTGESSSIFLFPSPLSKKGNQFLGKKKEEKSALVSYSLFDSIHVRPPTKKPLGRPVSSRISLRFSPHSGWFSPFLRIPLRCPLFTSQKRSLFSMRGKSSKFFVKRPGTCHRRRMSTSRQSFWVFFSKIQLVHLFRVQSHLTNEWPSQEWNDNIKLNKI